MTKYHHAEAFRLMKYRAPNGEIELIWNSRDGVTPFIVRLRSGNEAQHVDWRGDLLAPDYVPRLGERIFVDLTDGRAREIARSRVELFWDHPQCPAREQWPSKDVAVAALLPGIYGDGKQPDLIEVTPEVLCKLKATR